MPLAVLLKREHTSERMEKPDVLYGQASQSKKGEDFTFFKTECQRVPADGSTTFSVFAVYNTYSQIFLLFCSIQLLSTLLVSLSSNLL